MKDNELCVEETASVEFIDDLADIQMHCTGGY